MPRSAVERRGGMDGIDDLRDPEARERFETVAPEAYLRRREFLQRTAMTAGLAAGMATVLSPDTLVAEAATPAAPHRAARPAQPPDRHVRRADDGEPVVRPLPRLAAGGRRPPGWAGATRRRTDGRSRRTGCRRTSRAARYHDPDHSWDGGREQVDGGAMDGFLRSGDNDEFSVGYYAKEDLPFIPAAAQAFTTYDRFFCSLLASTFPNREYMHAAQSYGKKDNSFPDGTRLPRHDDLRRAEGQGGRLALLLQRPARCRRCGARRASTALGRVEEYYSACAAGTLPALSFVDPSFLNEGGGTSGDEHPHGDVRTGQAFMADVVHAFMESPQWKRGALFIVYDEWGGFFDHVAPAAVPDIRNVERHHQGLRADGPAHPGRGGLALRAPRLRRARHVRVRVDPQDHRVPLRPQAAHAPRRLRAQHRALVRLAVQAASSTCRSSRTRRTSRRRSARTVRPRRSTSPARRTRSGPSRTTWPRC